MHTGQLASIQAAGAADRLRRLIRQKTTVAATSAAAAIRAGPFGLVEGLVGQRPEEQAEDQVELEEYAAPDDERGQRAPCAQPRDGRRDHGDRPQPGRPAAQREPGLSPGLGEGRGPAEPRLGEPEARPEPGDCPLGGTPARHEQRGRAEDRDDLEAGHRQPQRELSRRGAFHLGRLTSREGQAPGWW